MLKVDKLEVVVDVSEVMNVYGGYDIDFMDLSFYTNRQNRQNPQK